MSASQSKPFVICYYSNISLIFLYYIKPFISISHPISYVVLFSHNALSLCLSMLNWIKRLMVPVTACHTQWRHFMSVLDQCWSGLARSSRKFAHWSSQNNFVAQYPALNSQASHHFLVCLKTNMSLKNSILTNRRRWCSMRDSLHPNHKIACNF